MKFVNPDYGYILYYIIEFRLTTFVPKALYIRILGIMLFY